MSRLPFIGRVAESLAPFERPKHLILRQDWLQIPRRNEIRRDRLVLPVPDRLGKRTWSRLAKPAGDSVELRPWPKTYRISVRPETRVLRDLLLGIGSTRISSNYASLEAPGSRDATDILIDSLLISDDLFVPLGKKPRSEGNRYRKDEVVQEELFTGDPKTEDRSGYRKSYREKRVSGRLTSRKEPSIWDLIFPILQPPISLITDIQLDLPSHLYRFQAEGVKFLLDRRYALLADDMGTGKTVQASVAMRIAFREKSMRSALIVAPLSVLRVWDEHLRDWAPDLQVTVVRGTVANRKIDWRAKAHVYIATYGVIRSDIDAIHSLHPTGFDLVVLDEAQAIKNPRSKQSRAVRKLEAAHRWALTGTPLESSLDDLVTICNFLKPRVLRADGLTPAKARKAIKSFFLRRRKEDVLTELPPKTYEDVWLELSGDQRTEYDEIYEHGITQLRREKGEQGKRLRGFALLTKLKQVCNFASNGNSVKAEWLSEVVDELEAAGHKALVFSEYLEQGVDRICEAMGEARSCKYVGRLRQRQRQDVQDRFANDPSITVFVATAKTAGVGLTLTEASYVVHFDHWWNPAVARQAEDRTHRIGQTRPVTIYHLWAEDTVDARIRDILRKKQGLFDETIDSLSTEAVAEKLTTEELFEILGIAEEYEPETAGGKKQSETVREIFACLQDIDPLGFEVLMAELWRVMGFGHVKTTSRTRDGGVDVSATWATPAGPVRVVGQCKKWNNAVGVTVARELAGTMVSDPSIHKGVLMATGDITEGARRFAGKCRIECWDGLQIAELVKRHSIELEA